MDKYYITYEASKGKDMTIGKSIGYRIFQTESLLTQAFIENQMERILKSSNEELGVNNDFILITNIIKLDRDARQKQESQNDTGE